MHAVTALAAGVAGAGNGTANLYARGTAQRATYYRDFEATQPASSELQLDANGRAVVYVDQLVDLVVDDSNGVEVLRCVAGAASSAVEVRSQSFTGTDYTTGASGPGKPTTLQRVLDAWLSSAGAVDWKVLIGATSTNLSTFAANVSGIVFNVKSPTYGAVGDGTTDDTSALQAALTAAATAGGGTVVLPPGTYRITEALDLDSSVSIVGSGGPAATFVTMDHATEDMINVAATSATEVSLISGVTLTTAQANSGQLISTTLDNTRLSLVDVHFRPGTGHTGICLYEVASAGCQFRLERVEFVLQPNDVAVQSVSATFWTNQVRTSWAAASAYSDTAWTLAGGAVLVASHWIGTLVTSGTPTLLIVAGASANALVGCYFTAAVAATVDLEKCQEIGTRSDSNITFALTGDTANSTRSATRFSGVESILETATNAAGSSTIPDDCGTLVLTNTFAGAFAVVTPKFVLNKRFTLVIHNNDGSNRVVTWGLGSGVGAVRPNATPTVNANTVSMFEFHAVYYNGVATWMYTQTMTNEAE